MADLERACVPCGPDHDNRGSGRGGELGEAARGQANRRGSCQCHLSRIAHGVRRRGQKQRDDKCEGRGEGADGLEFMQFVCHTESIDFRCPSRAG
jgi:hypothetical protein